MRAIRLEPERSDPPRCDDFGDLDAVRAFERAVRVHRGLTEPSLVTPLDCRVDGAYRVTTTGQSAYVVDVVDASGESDSCTCPDFLSNELGTCKHVEAVRRAVASNRQLRGAFARLSAAPEEPVLVLDAVGGLRLRALGPWSSEQRERYGHWLRRRLPRSAADRELRGGRGEDGVRVAHAAPAAIARLLARSVLTARRTAMSRAVDAGRVDIDLLRLPLFPYQREGVRHLAVAGRALLADDMGLGKTVQAIAACEALRRRGEAKRILVVTVASIKHQWAQEIQRYAGERAAIVRGGAAERRSALEAGAAYTILNYELTWRELSTLRELRPDVLILDEAQRAKNFRTKTAATLRSIPSRLLFVLTGTPIENRLDDLYSLLQLVDPTILGPLWRFNHDYHEQNERGRVTGYKNLAMLRTAIAPAVLRRRKEQVLDDLPEIVEQTRYTALTPEQVELEGAYRADAAQLLAMAERRPLRKHEQDRLMACLLKARQACNALELCDPGRKKRASPKLDEFEELVAEIASEDAGKILVFSEWVEMLKLAADRLERRGIRYETLHGGVPSDARPALLDRFRDDGEVRVLLSTDAGGVGLNLQVASFVVHLDLPWNPGKLDQRTARAHRLGQRRGVMVTYLCAEQGIERGIEGTLAAKRAVRAAALEVDATEDTLEAPSFSVFLRQMREVFLVADQPAAGDDGPSTPEPTNGVEPAAPLLEAPPPLLALPEASDLATIERGGDDAQPTAAEPASTPAWSARARDRLKLARLVHDAGFFGDALRAAYEGLATAIAGIAGQPAPENHAALVAVVYRDLLPIGALPEDAVPVLSRLHDLTTLERSGVAVDGSRARAAVEEAETWTARLAASDHAVRSLPAEAAPLQLGR